MRRSPKSPRVLVVENDVSMLKLLDSLLAANGYRATTALGETDAIRALDAQQEPFSLALVDFAPGVDAAAATRALRRDPRFGLRPVLALTPSTRPEDLDYIRDAGCDAYLRKPFHLDEFQRLVVSLVLGGEHGATDCAMAVVGHARPRGAEMDRFGGDPPWSVRPPVADGPRER